MRHSWRKRLDPRGTTGRSTCTRCGETKTWRHPHTAPFGGECPGGWTLHDPDTRVGDMPRRSPKPTPTAKFVGGPLDGETYVKDFGGRWPLYLDNEGDSIPARSGDRITRAADPDGCYAHRMEQAGEDWEHIYRHSSTLPSRA